MHPISGSWEILEKTLKAKMVIQPKWKKFALHQIINERPISDFAHAQICMVNVNKKSCDSHPLEAYRTSDEDFRYSEIDLQSESASRSKRMESGTQSTPKRRGVPGAHAPGFNEELSTDACGSPLMTATQPQMKRPASSCLPSPSQSQPTKKVIVSCVFRRQVEVI
jgi:hypothetical protein